MIVEVVLEEHAPQIEFVALSVGFLKNNFAQHARPVAELRGQEQIKIARKEASRRPGNESVRPQLRLALVEDLVIGLSETAPLNAEQLVQRGVHFRRTGSGVGRRYRRGCV